MQQLADISLPLTPDIVTKALEWLERVGKQQQWPARSLFKLKVCLDETLTNIAMYGFDTAELAGDAQIRLRVLQKGRHVALEIYDNGVAFDPTEQTSRALDESLEEARIGGHGLRLLRHYLEDLRYERRDGWNQLTLIAALDDS